MRLAAVLLATACYQPTVATGVPCSSERDCPSGQVCAASDRCELPGRDATPSVDELPIDGPLGAFSAPQKLVELNSPELDTDPTISADGLEIVFSSSRPGGIGGTDLYRATRDAITDPFGQPQRIFELSTPDLDNASDLAGDGLTIYLRRIGPTATADVYRARRDARTLPFGFPVYEAALSSDLEETNPAISRDGRTFSTTRPTAAARELYIHELQNNGAWGPAQHLPELTSPLDDSGAAFGTNSLVIFFHSERGSTVGSADLYVAMRPNKNQPYATPEPLVELNTPLNESDPSITADLRYIVFECELDLCYATR